MADRGRRCKVLIVGAGLTGLMLAHRLRAVDVDVVVLEARDRVGGRTLSREIQGATFDLGAQWIGPTQLRLRNLLDELGMRSFPQHAEGRKVLDHRGRRATYRGDIPALSLFDLARTELMIRKVDRMASRVPLEMPQRAYRAGEWDALSVEAFKRQLLGKSDLGMLLDVAVRTVFGAEPAELSLLYFLFYLNSAGGFRRLVDIRGGAQQERFAEGAQAIARALVQRVGEERVVLGAPVRAIEQRHDEVRVASAAGTFATERVVVAIPPSLTGNIEYHPALPALRQQLVQRWPMGATVKVFAFYERARWRERGYSGEVVSTGGPLSVIFDATSEDGRVPCLLGFVVGKHARRWGRMDRAERRATALAEMERLLEVPASEVVEYLEQDWAEECWTGGCPVASMGPGGLSTFADVWRVPVGRLHWAGTETARHWNGYLEGALESAERVASEVAHFLEP